MLHPRVSVVMPTYNRADLMRQSVEMLLQQTLDDFELIIVDDQSTDHTALVAAELMAKDKRIQYHRLSEKGFVVGAMNAGILLSQGDYIQICHDHDIYLPQMLEKLLDVFDRNPSVVYAHPGLIWVDFEGNPIPGGNFISGYPEVCDGKVWQRMMLARNDSPVPALSMIRRRALEQVGLFDPHFGIATDVEMWLRLSGIGDVGYVNKLLLKVRTREPDHPYAGVNWRIKDEVIRAHRKYLKACYQGARYFYHRGRYELMTDYELLISYIYCLYHGHNDSVSQGRTYLRRHGLFASRIIAWFL